MSADAQSAAAARGLILEEDEVREITGYRKTAAQARFFASVGVTVFRRKNGSLVVGRAAVERALGGPEKAIPAEENAGIKWRVN